MSDALDTTFREQDFLGRLMAHEFISELESIEQEKVAAYSGVSLKKATKPETPKQRIKRLLKNKATKKPSL